MTPHRGTKCLLVLVCTFSGWVEAFPTGTEKAREVTKVLLREIIPRYGLPLTIHSDNGPVLSQMYYGLWPRPSMSSENFTRPTDLRVQGK